MGNAKGATKRVELKSVRAERGLTLEQLAELSGVSVSQINRLEKGESFPMLDTAQRLEDALGVSLKFTRQSSPQEAA